MSDTDLFLQLAEKQLSRPFRSQKQRQQRSPQAASSPVQQAASTARKQVGSQDDHEDNPTQATGLEPHTMTPASIRESKIAQELASYQASLIATIRKTVRQLGKEVSFVRLTAEEKQKLADIVYTYKRQGVRTSENEINRIAINYLLEDYLAHGQASILAKVLEAVYA